MKPASRARATLENWLHGQWSKKGLFSLVFSPLSLAFLAVSRYREKHATPERLPVPVVIVGNIYVGGTGKTPVTIAIARGLMKRGWKPGIISRGYGRKSDAVQLVTPDSRAAPTAANMQPVRLIVVKSKEGLEKVGKAANIYQAPAAIVVCANKTKAWKRPFDGKITTDIDASILTDHMMLEATELGLGSVWICYFNPDILKEELNLPENLEPVNILALGYSDEPDASAERHKDMRIGMDELVSYL